jgi:hypothetical protein
MKFGKALVEKQAMHIASFGSTLNKGLKELR